MLIGASGLPLWLHRIGVPEWVDTGALVAFGLAMWILQVTWLARRLRRPGEVPVTWRNMLLVCLLLSIVELAFIWARETRS